MENGLINIDKEKMSKWLGKLILVEEIIKEIDGDVVGLFMISVD